MNVQWLSTRKNFQLLQILFTGDKLDLKYICHGRKSNLVEFQILPVESPVGVSTNINLVESPIGVSTSRKSNQGDLGIALGSEIY